VRVSPSRWPLEAIGTLALLAVWQALALVAQSRVLPGPLAVGEKLLALASTGPLLTDLSATLLRAGCSFALAMGLGSAAGYLLGRHRNIDRLLQPLLVTGLNLPAIVIAILVYIWLGLTEAALVLAVTLNKLPLVAVTLREGTRALSADYDELSIALRLSPLRRLHAVVLPQLVPYFLAAARAGISLIWKIVLVFEILGADRGIGFRISLYFQFFDVASILAYAVLFLGVVVLIEAFVLRPLERRVLRWRA
jgi:NitT/TauT family transport system permease protein